MSLSAAVLDAMVAAGCTAEQLAAAVKADLVAEEARREAKRAGNAKRQREFKERRKVTAGNGSNALPSVTPPPNDIYSNPPPSSPSVVSNETTPPTDLILVSAEPEAEPLKPEHVVEVWNDVAERRGLAKVKTLTPQRRRKLASRIKEAGVDGFTEAIGTIEASPFLRGENGRGWRADFDWMLEPKNFTKLREGAYGH